MHAQHVSGAVSGRRAKYYFDMFVFYDWPFPHMYFAENVAYFPFNSWLNFQRLLWDINKQTIYIAPKSNQRRITPLEPARGTPRAGCRGVMRLRFEL